MSACIHGGANISIGDGCFVNYQAWIENNVVIGKNCNIAYKVTFCTSTHIIGDNTRRAGASMSDEIKVGDGTWIGANALILPGIHIGSGCIIGAGSVVTKDCIDNGVYAGNPAMLIRKLDDK